MKTFIYTAEYKRNCKVLIKVWRVKLNNPEKVGERVYTTASWKGEAGSVHTLIAKHGKLSAKHFNGYKISHPDIKVIDLGYVI